MAARRGRTHALGRPVTKGCWLGWRLIADKPVGVDTRKRALVQSKKLPDACRAAFFFSLVRSLSLTLAV